MYEPTTNKVDSPDQEDFCISFSMFYDAWLLSLQSSIFLHAKRSHQQKQGEGLKQGARNPDKKRHVVFVYT